MIYLIARASHTGKTLLAQKLLEKHHYPYLSIDHLKMGLIRSGQTDLTPEDDDKLMNYIWSIVCEMVKTAIENRQNLIVEGCSIPFDYKKDFSQEYLEHIKYICLLFSEEYIKNNYDTIIAHSNAIESRLTNYYSIETMLEDNKLSLEQCRKHNCNYLCVKGDYLGEIGAYLK